MKNLHRFLSKFDNKKNARHEYKSVMQKLKYPHKESKFAVDNVQDTRKRSAYLKEAEIAVDDWLDDDLGPSKKKQKKFFNENVIKSTMLEEKSPIKTAQTQNFTRKPSLNLISSNSDNECENLSDIISNSVDAFDVIMSTNGEGSKKKSRRNSNAKLQRRTSNQSSLLDAGFSKFIDFDESTRKSYTSSTSSNNYSLNESFNRSNQLEKQTIIKVQIDDEKIIVPINREAANELKISWLIDESARRYYW